MTKRLGPIVLSCLISAPSYNWRDTLTWDVFSDAGELLGVVTFPFRTSFVTATGDQVWGIQAGEYREDYVVRWRIERTGS